ncbi:MAG TPA: cardiolipin synthase B, partial [Vicinamibacteria bacterium]
GSLPEEERPKPGTMPDGGQVALRVVATTSGTSGLYRVDPLMAALARRTLWLTDAYYAGTPAYVQALRGAAQDGVDVRLLKTAVADARWARVGSTNLNLASWIGNWELDVVVEDEAFGQAMEAMYLDDLGNATEIVLEQRRRVRPAGGGQVPRRRGAGGTAGRAAAGALRIGHAIGSALTARRLHGPAEQRLMVQGAVALTAVAATAFLWPRLVAWPVGALCFWLALSLFLRARRR